MVNYKLIIEYHQKGNNTQVAVRVQAFFLIRWLQTERMRFMLWTALVIILYVCEYRCSQIHFCQV